MTTSIGSVSEQSTASRAHTWKDPMQRRRLAVIETDKWVRMLYHARARDGWHRVTTKCSTVMACLARASLA